MKIELSHEDVVTACQLYLVRKGLNPNEVAELRGRFVRNPASDKKMRLVLESRDQRSEIRDQRSETDRCGLIAVEDDAAGDVEMSRCVPFER